MRGGVSGRSRGRRAVARGDPRRSGASFARGRRKNSRAHSGARDRAPRRARELSRAPSAATRSRTARPRIEPRGTAAIARVGPRPEDVVRHSIVELGRTAYFTLSRANGMERRRFVRGRAPPERRRERRGSRAARSNDDARRGRALRGAKTGRAALCGRDCGGAGGVGRPSSARLAGGKSCRLIRALELERAPACQLCRQSISVFARASRPSKRALDVMGVYEEKWSRGCGTGIGLSNHKTTYRCARRRVPPPPAGVAAPRSNWISLSTPSLAGNAVASLTSDPPRVPLPRLQARRHHR